MTTAVVVDRRLAYQRRNVAAGKCRYCPEPLFRAGRCIIHYADHLRQRKRARKNR